MKIILLLFSFFYINLTLSGTYKVEAYMDTTISGDTKLPDSRTYRTFSLDGMWKDSLGDIGTIKGFGKVESLSGEPNLEVMGVQTNEDGDKLWAIYRRDSTDVQVGGGGISTFLAGTGKFQFLVNYKCRFVARYLQNRNFTVIKCNIPDEILQKVINYKKQ
tara:strand:- start:159 stop:641 length:483 start_codon:yes stop_codon:yes gene_type:complete